MSRVFRIVDVSEDLLHAIERADADLNPTRVETRRHVTAPVMREVGFSDDEIIQKLGCLPEPFSGESQSTSARRGSRSRR